MVMQLLAINYLHQLYSISFRHLILHLISPSASHFPSHEFGSLPLSLCPSSDLSLFLSLYHSLFKYKLVISMRGAELKINESGDEENRERERERASIK